MKTHLTICLTLAMGCNAALAEGELKATIQTDKPQQKVLHFGASDAWSMQFIGNWDEK